jgi:hypothetical protein
MARALVAAADDRLAAQAGRAAAAVAAEREDHVVAWGYLGDAGPDGLDDARALVTHDHRIRPVAQPVEEV